MDLKQDEKKFNDQLESYAIETANEVEDIDIDELEWLVKAGAKWARKFIGEHLANNKSLKGD